MLSLVSSFLLAGVVMAIGALFTLTRNGRQQRPQPRTPVIAVTPPRG